MLGNLFRHLKSKDGTHDAAGAPTISDFPPSEQPSEEARLDFWGLKVYRELATFTHSELRRVPDWQLPLPYDVVLLILDLEDAPAICNLSLACASLSHICRPFRLRRISINTKYRQAPTTLGHFAVSLSRFPDMVELIQDLRITDDRVDCWDRSITEEEEMLCFILTRPYPKLTRLELSFKVAWSESALHNHLQHAFHILFARQTLRELVFARARIFVNVLAHLPHISSLEIRGNAYRLPSASSGSSESLCTPERLLFYDTTRTGLAIKNLFHENSPLKLTRLKKLEAYISGETTQHVALPIGMCATTLTTLHLYVGTSEPRPYALLFPTSIDLSPLTQLQELLLTCDLNEVDYNGMHLLAERQFSWLLNAIVSLGPFRHPVQHLSQITFIIRNRRFGFARHVPWRLLDALFSEPPRDKRWPKLERVDVRMITQDRHDDMWCLSDSVEKVMHPMMPVLHAAGVLKIHTSVETLDFWRL